MRDPIDPRLTVLIKSIVGKGAGAIGILCIAKTLRTTSTSAWPELNNATQDLEDVLLRHHDEPDDEIDRDTLAMETQELLQSEWANPKNRASCLEAIARFLQSIPTTRTEIHQSATLAADAVNLALGTPADYELHYSAIDGATDLRRFVSLQAATTFAHTMIGQCPERGRSYAVSADGIGKISGPSLNAIYPHDHNGE